MNVIKGTLHKSGGRAWVDAEGAEWPVGPATQGREGQAVHYGVRPTDVAISSTGQGIPAKVIVVEPTGAETELLVEIGGSRLVLVIHGRTDANPDDIIHLDIEASKAHLFDQGSGQRID